jgi:hypothetical protein
MQFRAQLSKTGALLTVITAFSSCTRSQPSDPVPEDRVISRGEPQAANNNAGPLADKLSNSAQVTNAQAEVPAASNQPSTGENMGRGFQGVMQLRIEATGKPPRTLRFMSLGNASRLQSEGSPPFDVLFLDEKVVVLDHAKKEYRTAKLDDLKERSDTGNVKSERLETRQSIEKVTCSDWRLTEGPLRIDACVAGLPGQFNVGKFETATGVHIPAWAKSLFAEEYLPVMATVYDAGGKPVYSLKLEEYGPGPVDAQLFTVPSNYRQL